MARLKSQAVQNTSKSPEDLIIPFLTLNRLGDIVFRPDSLNEVFSRSLSRKIGYFIFLQYQLPKSKKTHGVRGDCLRNLCSLSARYLTFIQQQSRSRFKLKEFRRGLVRNAGKRFPLLLHQLRERINIMLGRRF